MIIPIEVFGIYIW